LLRETLAPLPEGLDSPELRVARILLDRLQDEHAEQEELERILSDAPWEVRHIPHPASPPYLEPL
jgi:hypothetical protein